MTDENTLAAPPPAWRRARHPRRDRPGVPKAPATDPSAAGRVRSLVDAVRDDIDHVLARPEAAPDIVDAARAHLRGEPDPLGAVAVAYLAAPLNGMRPWRYDPLPSEVFTEALVAEHGLPFAARAFAEWAGIAADNPASIGGKGLPMRLSTARHRAELRSITLRRQAPDELLSDWWLTPGSARTMRTRLAAAPGDVYAEAVELVGGARRTPLQKVVAAYLAPTREDWVDDMCRPGTIPFEYDWTIRLAFCALGRPDQPAALDRPFGHACDHDVVVTLIDGIGADAVVPLLVDALDGSSHGYTEELRMILGVLARLPVDDALRALVDRIGEPEVVPALLEASRRFPVRALRLLPASDAPRAAEVLSAHVRADPGTAADVARDLPDDGRRAKIREILAANTRVPAVPAAGLPPVLTEPPWTRPRAKAKPVVVEDLPAPGVRAVTWAPGERAEWAAWYADRWDRWAENVDFARIAKMLSDGDVGGHVGEWLLFLRGPDDLARPLPANWDPGDGRDESANTGLAPLIARHELDAIDPALSLVRGDPAALGRFALPLLSDEFARTMADWLVRLRSGGRTARAWFDRHGTAAAPALIPDALGKPGPARRAAEAALRLIAERHDPAPIVEAARVHGDRAATAIEALLATDPVDVLPKTVPSVEWADPRALPQILLRDRTHALPDDAAGHVLTMLAMSKPDDEYAGLPIVRDLCDPASLAEFGWALFRWWETNGAPSKEKWALTQLALTGDDDTVRRLTPVIRAWPGDGGHAKAVTGLDVLAAIGTDTALMHLHSISQRVKFKGLKTRAQEKIRELAAELELTPDQLADRLVPDFGLDADGTLTLDYGPRAFVVGFDEVLRPTVTDEHGKLRKSLPKPAAKDDPDLAPAAYKHFSGVKKDVRTIASDQLARLERAMVTGRRRTAAEFREFLVAHPLVGHLVRRLVWRVAEDGPAFRVAEDGTFATAADDTIVVPGTAEILVAHPVHLGDEVKAWTDLFADYEILQPFEQLARPIHMLTADERDGGRLPRFEGAGAATRDLLALTRRGWERGTPMDVGIEHCISREVGPDRHVVLSLDPGIVVGDPDRATDFQDLADVRLAFRPDRHAPAEPTSLRFGDLDPAVASEILADLIRVTTRAEEPTR
ncbi:hypothetical protein BJF79_32240 [Actinomadura sp. CNU-125]|uniref:DUF4132 domain-containing protein n=1 Tax=Actinomadura sp. CNU-125 TaxID=1904961 RepID=UPI00095A3487|nr:DUF4132 domain-containing protein [Actinomadura sp. CNU-125]OLT35566.1 hypothetical protein BJF79_32240 [Actinomadura sp. CNU-125]